MGKQASNKRVVLAKLVATRWLEASVHPEYRLKVYAGSVEINRVPSLLRSFRDSKLKIGSVDPIPDLGIKEGFDHVELWSSDSEGLRKLQAWFEERGCETTGVW